MQDTAAGIIRSNAFSPVGSFIFNRADDNEMFENVQEPNKISFHPSKCLAQLVAGVGWSTLGFETSCSRDSEA
jgi:hypothetical protein